MAGKNQGEGNRDAAKAYNRHVREHQKTHDTEAEAREAREATEGKDRDKLKKAEEVGKAHAKEVDPQVKRDY